MLKRNKLEKLYPSTDVSVSLAAVSPTTIFCQVKESCLHHLLETKAQLW